MKKLFLFLTILSSSIYPVDQLVKQALYNIKELNSKVLSEEADNLFTFAKNNDVQGVEKSTAILAGHVDSFVFALADIVLYKAKLEQEKEQLLALLHFFSQQELFWRDEFQEQRKPFYYKGISRNLYRSSYSEMIQEKFTQIAIVKNKLAEKLGQVQSKCLIVDNLDKQEVQGFMSEVQEYEPFDLSMFEENKHLVARLSSIVRYPFEYILAITGAITFMSVLYKNQDAIASAVDRGKHAVEKFYEEQVKSSFDNIVDMLWNDNYKKLSEVHMPPPAVWNFHSYFFC